MDAVLEKCLKDMVSKTQRYDQTFQSIPMITSSDGLSALCLPDLAPTRQVRWALILSRLKHMLFMVTYCKEAISINGKEIIDLQRELKRLKNDKVFESYLSGQLLTNTLAQVDALLNTPI